ncbi:SulP family inorganic anion transporter [Arhodomonas aquaeolei]|uniref:SulP family inorganic anion transporter n=1 Tax=Arhodomonas aquaeolei TaxID=2369 RepID=UPI00035C6227|nr:SulP family inorganic anion transporter [Arhodomonas aquaeolei]
MARWPRFTLAALRADAVAGGIGGLLALPQVIAYALIAGVPAEWGLRSAVVVTAVAALAGSSREMITGPAAALSLLTFAVVSPLAEPGSGDYLMLVVTVMALAGVMQLAVGLLRLGRLVNFVSHTVIVGFTAGAAVLIAWSQVPELLGAGSTNSPGAMLQQASWPSVATGAGVILAILVLRRLGLRGGALLGGLVAGSAGVALAGGGDVARVGTLSLASLPAIHPVISPGRLPQLVPGAAAIALLGLLEAAAIARALGRRSGQRIDADRECTGQGVSNLVGSFLGCLPGTGSFTRSAANQEAGARTSVAALVSAVTVAAVALAWPGLGQWLPLPAMAGVILVVAVRLVDVPAIREVLRAGRGEAAVLVATFLATVFLELAYAVLIGVVVSLFVYLAQAARPRIVEVAPRADRPGRDLRNAGKHELAVCPQFAVLRVDGAVFFGAVEHVRDAVRAHTGPERPYLLVIGSGIPLIDVAGAGMLAEEAERLEGMGGALVICSLKDDVRRALHRTGHADRPGQPRLSANPGTAIAETVPRLDDATCARCTVRIFRECAARPGGPAHVAGLSPPDAGT